MKKALILMGMASLTLGVAFAGSITVTAPNDAGVSLCLGKPYNITWTVTGVSQQLKITLIRSGGALVGSIQTGLTAGTTSYLWTAGNYIGGTADPGTDYRIRVSTVDGSVMDKSDNAFELKTCTDDTGPQANLAVAKDFKAYAIGITVKAPKTGDYWDGGATKTIQWETFLKNALKVELYNYNGKKFVRIIAPSLTTYPTDGKWSFAWQIPTDINPGWYQVRVSSAGDKYQGFSTKFFIRQSISNKTYTLSATTTNKYKYRIKRKKEFTISPKIYDDPGAGKIRVGYNGYTSDHTDYAVIYRGHAAFNINNYKDKGFLLKAKLSFKHFMGCSTPIKVYVLDQAWNGDAAALFSVSCSHVPDPANVTQIVQGWLAYPDTNHGFVFVGPNESMAYANGECVGFYENIKLELEFISSQQP
jgi:hypothetical protein